jgi:acyl-coenzyme A synthetase/AMP-(fatty) acid ligase
VSLWAKVSIRQLTVLQNLFPIQIENVLLTHPDIVEAAVISVPNTQYGEVVGAWIVLREGSNLTREAVRAVVTKGMNPQVCLSKRLYDRFSI